MTDRNSTIPVMDLFVFETNQLLEQLEQLVLDSEKSGGLSSAIDEIFRIMHTIKGSAAMMLFNNISSLAHSLEDVFFYLREVQSQTADYTELTDIVLKVVDFIKGEVIKAEVGENLDGDCNALTEEVRAFLTALKETGPTLDRNAKSESDEISPSHFYIAAKKNADVTDKRVCEALVFFDEDCGMENIRAFTLVHELSVLAEDIDYIPSDILENESTAEIIRQEGFKLTFAAKNSLEEIEGFFNKTMFLKDTKVNVLNDGITMQTKKKKHIDLDGPLICVPMDTLINKIEPDQQTAGIKQNFINVNVSKMDMLMDLVGELVIAEAMVTQNPELKGLSLDNFHKSARQLKKITKELQDVVMSVRMVPLSMTFNKMNRIVRDMSKRLNKQAELEIVGEATEVDKNIIEHISDPLMHLIRNSLDHGLEAAQERLEKGKPAIGKIRLEAKNTGGDVLIIVKDDGRGLDKDKILQKAQERGLVSQDVNLSDKEIYSFILKAGFSTKEAVTEFSGRGVGMDVVTQNIEKVGGTVSIDSMVGEGTTMTIKIPLTLAIIDGMVVKVGQAVYTIPINAVRESFRVKDHNVIKDTDDNEMIMIRGECYPIIRLYERFGINAAASEFSEGIMVMVECEGKSLCLFGDLLLGQQQVVIKALPRYIKKIQGIAGCTILGDGSVSLILDVAGLC